MRTGKGMTTTREPIYQRFLLYVLSALATFAVLFAITPLQKFIGVPIWIVYPVGGSGIAILALVTKLRLVMPLSSKLRFVPPRGYDPSSCRGTEFPGQGALSRCKKPPGSAWCASRAAKPFAWQSQTEFWERAQDGGLSSLTKWQCG